MSQLAILGGNKTIEMKGPHFVWPRITKAVERAVVRQLHDTISIYNRSGVIKEFETTFANYHSRQYGVLANSGTNAIYSIYEGLSLGPGDQVICPIYTFFATVSPLMYTGATPIFCDCNPDGNINPAKIEDLITSRTKAVMVTHMWGIPCDMDEILSICRKHNLYLLEDCSHAHGAKVAGKLVGQFGQAAAWSLQGQKTITGGEGGIMLTDDSEIFYRALLQGHYNKRCKQEIPANHPLMEFSTTGFGLKFRAHPLAVAIAQEQFSHLNLWLQQRERYAAQMTHAFSQFPFFRMPQVSGKEPGWYAYVMQFDPSLANGISIDLFLEAVLAEGLVELDRPGSTGPLHHLPLFSEPEKVFPRLYPHAVPRTEQSFPEAERFYQNALKLPMWSFPEDQQIVDLYTEGIVKVALVVRDDPTRLLDLQIRESSNE